MGEHRRESPMPVPLAACVGRAPCHHMIIAGGLAESLLGTRSLGGGGGGGGGVGGGGGGAKRRDVDLLRFLIIQ